MERIVLFDGVCNLYVPGVLAKRDPTLGCCLRNLGAQADHAATRAPTCHLCRCEGVVQFIVAYDPKAVFKFASLQSQAAAPLIQACGIPEEEIMNSFIMVERTPGFLPEAPAEPTADSASSAGTFRFYRASTAALQIGRHLETPLSWLAHPALLLPAALRDSVYYCVARNRYLMFGKKQACMMPTKALKARFLDWGEGRAAAAAGGSAGAAQGSPRARSRSKAPKLQD